jgi:hypothetical protein
VSGASAAVPAGEHAAAQGMNSAAKARRKPLLAMVAVLLLAMADCRRSGVVEAKATWSSGAATRWCG